LATFYDIFNGDADGICALQQLRLEEPRASVLITGVKRDIALVRRAPACAGDELTVLDVSFKSNAEAVVGALEAGASCRYFDHHNPGTLPKHANLRTFIDTAADICTSLIIDRYLGGRRRIWAVVAAFGDNLEKSARRAAETLQLQSTDVERLRELGECINYNAYGESVDDLHYHPADLFETMSHYADPLEFIESEPVFDVLRNAWQDDLVRAEGLAPQFAAGATALFVLPNAAWSRRISGLFANGLASRHPERAHAILLQKDEGYVVSVRAPTAKPAGADELCLKFETGGGRKGAAGINLLPQAELDRFVAEFKSAFGG
jgi:hypothetical protein